MSKAYLNPYNHSMNYVSSYNSPLGKVTLASDGVSLVGLWFKGQKFFASSLSDTCSEEELPIFDETIKWLDTYFSGNKPNFTPRILMSGNHFRKSIWNIFLTIPYGQTVTYGEIASEYAIENGISKMSAQAVGGAIAHNTVSIIIPCHRVVGASGNLTGYAGGIERKRKLLNIEGLEI